MDISDLELDDDIGNIDPRRLRVTAPGGLASASARVQPAVPEAQACGAPQQVQHDGNARRPASQVVNAHKLCTLLYLHMHVCMSFCVVDRDALCTAPVASSMHTYSTPWQGLVGDTCHSMQETNVSSTQCMTCLHASQQRHAMASKAKVIHVAGASASGAAYTRPSRAAGCSNQGWSDAS